MREICKKYTDEKEDFKLKKISILGSTGSIGRQGIEVIKRTGAKVTALACGRNIETLSEQIHELKPELVSVASQDDAKLLATKHPSVEVMWGREGLIAVAESEADILLNGIMGMVGLEPTYRAILKGRDIALANKETLVAGGSLIMDAVKKNGVKLLPVDSEHSAIFQSLSSYSGTKDISEVVRRVILTASGGPFRGYTGDELENVTLEEALNHPNWSMGKKITVDSATMMNKGLEVIEAKWLFDLKLTQIDVHVHPESIVHSAVEFVDGSIIAQMGVPDMKVPIAYALNYGERNSLGEGETQYTDLFEIGRLTFEKPDISTFRCLAMAFAASEEGKSYPVVLNSANEELVDLFLNGEIRFIDIQNILENILEKHKPSDLSTLEDILAMDREVRDKVRRRIW